jgi:hypothetical protein
MLHVGRLDGMRIFRRGCSERILCYFHYFVNILKFRNVAYADQQGDYKMWSYMSGIERQY